jgi:tartronate-semialdehyde synthase
MGTEIDGVVEFEELATSAAHVPTAVGSLDLEGMQYLD